MIKTRTLIATLALTLSASYVCTTYAPINDGATPTGESACWTETNTDSPTGVEPICGDTSLMPSGAVRIEEDSALWDCATMGNAICGPKF